MAMQVTPAVYNEQEFDDLAHRGLAVYEDFLKDALERDHMGDVVAINPESREYAIGDDSFAAVKAMRSQGISARVFVRRIGPPTDGDNRLSSRVAAAEAKNTVQDAAHSLSPTLG